MRISDWSSDVCSSDLRTSPLNLYRLDAPAAAVAAALGAEAGDDPWRGDYVAPGRPAPVIVGDGRGGTRRYLRPKLWGVPPPPRGTQPITPVRSLASPFWLGQLPHAELRCLVPATSFALGPGAGGRSAALRVGEEWGSTV